MQRVAVVEYLRSSHAHPTADAVHRAVSAKHPSISRATVYNTLHALVDAGLVCELTVDREAARYDLCAEPHAHFLCRACQCVYDIDLADRIGAGEIIDGHRVESVSTYLYGLCAACRERGKAPDHA
jgi:Fe2+ or Zn2+ uptake regulation protein